MVKTRSQNIKDCVSSNTIITEGMVTRLQKKREQSKHTPVQTALKKNILPKIEITDRIKNKIKIRQQRRKQVVKNQTSILNEIQMNANDLKKQNNDEMTSVWKNFESIFKYIDEFMIFKKRVEGK